MADTSDSTTSSKDAPRSWWKRPAALGGLVVLVGAIAAAAFVLTRGTEIEPVVAVATTTTTTEAPVVEEVVVEAPEAIAPLTGMPSTIEAVSRPVIFAKIDAAPPAMPQSGLHVADIVMEAKVEGSNRYLAVWHSQDPEVIGPLRSARTTDIDLLAQFGKPLFAYSGGNAKVLDIVAGVPWKVNLSHSTASAAYFRTGDRRMPHNLMANTAVLREHNAEGVAPAPVFTFHEAGATPAGTPVTSFAASAGARAVFTWDEALGGWRRNVHDRDHVDAAGDPVAPVNVVVLDTPYGISAADENSPEAHTVGSGTAWVFSRGHAVDGTWTRPDNTAGWNLKDGAGVPITLEPGRTWVVLATGAPELLAG